MSTAPPAGHDWAPPTTRPMVEAAIAAARADPRIVGLMVSGSAGTGTMDEFSDLDFVVVCRDEHQPELLEEAPAFAARLGYGAAKVGRGELFECLDVLAAFRTPEGCLAALRASVDLYRRLRADLSGLVRRDAAEAAAVDYLDEIRARVATP